MAKYIKHNCELDKLKKTITMVDKRTELINKYTWEVGTDIHCPRGRNARLKVFSSGNTE